MFKRIFQQWKFRARARQLRKPSGRQAEKTGLMMNKANAFLYDRTLSIMNLQPEESILEIGFGNGKLFEKLFTLSPSLHVAGLDFSKENIAAAAKHNQEYIAAGRLVIEKGNSNQMPFADNSFDKVFCINVVYFWDEPSPHLQEVKRVLKPGGRFYVTIRTRESLDMMPFTRYGFTKYDEKDWKTLAEANGLVFEKGEKLEEPESDFYGRPFRVQSVCLVARKED